MSTTSTPVFSEHELDIFNSIRDAKENLRISKNQLKDSEERLEKATLGASTEQKQVLAHRESVDRYEQKLIDLRRTVLRLFGSKEEPVTTTVVIDPEDIGSRER